MDSQQTKTIDYDALYNVQLDFINERHLKWKDNNYYGHSLDTYLRDCKTICLGGPRQSGKSEWTFKKLKEDNHTSVVVYNDDIRKALIKRENPTSNQIERIFTPHEIQKHILFDELPYIGKRIILDDAFYIFDRMKFRSFYKWISLKQDWDLHVIKVA